MSFHSPTEAIVMAQLQEQGFITLQDGWPDILAYKVNPDQPLDINIKFVEVKRWNDRLRPHQAELLDAIAAAFAGQGVYVARQAKNGDIKFFSLAEYERLEEDLR